MNQTTGQRSLPPEHSKLNLTNVNSSIKERSSSPGVSDRGDATGKG